MKRFAWFDSIRCLAVLLVMWAHSANVSALLFPTGLAQVANFFHAQGGALGVNLFFVLSGFLVSGLLFDEHDAKGTVSMGRFLIRRAFKIVPAFYFLVLVTLLVDATRGDSIKLDSLFHDIFFLQSYREGAWPHAWTLAVEVHFYILLALLLSYLSRTPPANGEWLRRLPGIIVGVMIACFLLRWGTLEFRASFHAHNQMLRSHLNLDTLAAGVLLRYLHIYHAEYLAVFRRGKIFWIALAAALIFGPVLPGHPLSAVVTAFSWTLFDLGTALILIQATYAPFPQAGPWRWLVQPFDFLGKHSYSIYLWHLPFRMWIVDSLFKTPGWGYIVFYFLGSLALGSLLSVALEMPVLHLRNRLFPSNAPQAEGLAAP